MSPSSDAYEVLGVTSSATDDELRRAYRRALRRTHPDTGGVAVEFHAVQVAWEAVGTAEDRARYDRTSSAFPAAGSSRSPWSTWSPPNSADSAGTRTGRSSFRSPASPGATYGHAGLWWRKQYVTGVGEWARQMGMASVDPYDARLASALPGSVRQCLIAAMTEEATATALTGVGSSFSIWHDVSTEVAGGNPAEKLDHVVLGPTGLFALLSEDRGGEVYVRGGDVTGDGFGRRERPIRTLISRANFFSENMGVRFTAVIMVVPDDAGITVPTEVSRLRGLSAVLVRRSDLSPFLRLGLPGTLPVSPETVTAAREHLRRAVQLI
ncbi:DnaJ-like protein [Glaciihabitans tibetensis]|uniref:DnaJ-like protein n=1 Tax=Glaciihabitans tibetensis TaxID=1266600 RepID=A0A2T0VE79_9MICO|nr:DnaJ domain-containing protein [Glaciihabitans tibetensis]PRY68493.1 DnaJ-like protein [Glaciihabitans tibetensis]